MSAKSPGAFCFPQLCHVSSIGQRSTYEEIDNTLTINYTGIHKDDHINANSEGQGHRNQRHSSFTKVLSNLQEYPRELTNQVDAVKFYGEHCI